MELNEWEAATAADVSVEQLDNLVKDYAEKRAVHEKVKKLKTEAYNEMTQAENKLLAYLQQCNKKSYKVDGIGNVTRKVKFSVRVPKDFESKKQLLQHFSDMGEDGYLSYVSVNSATLNSYYNQMMKDDPTFTLPGVEAPTGDESLSFTKLKDNRRTRR